jgi:hypothetical protein
VFEAEQVDQGRRVPRHSGDGFTRHSRAESNCRVVGEDHLAALSESLGDRRVVVVEVPHEVLQQHDRCAERISEPPVGEAGSAGVEESGRRGVVRELAAGG